MKTPLTLQHTDRIIIKRDAAGIPHVEARNGKDLFYGQGYVQARDRGLQILLTRIIGQGRACEILKNSEEMFELDVYFRRLNWKGDTPGEKEKLPPELRGFMQSFCDGINAGLAEKNPWELKLIDYRPEEWRIEDTLLVVKMIGYIQLGQAQSDMERLIVEMIQAGIDAERLEELFPGKLEGLDIHLLRKVKLNSRIVPKALRWNRLLPGFNGSNNWAVSGRKTESGKPLLANDPHLEPNRLPNVMQEISLRIADRHALGVCIPGLPGILIGRNDFVAWGVTYSFLDGVDSWVEECKGGKFKRRYDTRHEWVRFRERREIIKRRGGQEVIVPIFENEHGCLDGDPNEEGFYLATSWSGGSETGAKSLEAAVNMLFVRDVRMAMEIAGTIEMSFNWVFADLEGNIGYQMSGLLPRRRKGVSGLIPLPGWESKNDWKGFESPSRLPRRFNPAEGYIVTANNDLNSWGKSTPCNMAMGDYRARRIEQLLKEKKKLNGADMVRIQYDLYSGQAARFMEVLRDLLPETEDGIALSDWDCRYDKNSRGAALFEKFYLTLFRLVFGTNGLGEKIVDHLFERTGIPVDFYSTFDEVLLAPQSIWFCGLSREELYGQALTLALKNNGPQGRPGGASRLFLKHILLGGKLPRFLGFDRGPYWLPGGRSTPFQVQLYREGNRETGFAPIYRMVADLAETGLFTNLLGGPSDRRFSRWYASDVKNWLGGKYKRLLP